MLITWGVVAQSPEPGAHVSNAQPIKIGLTKGYHSKSTAAI